MCDCEDLSTDLFVKDENYGWLIKWKEFTKDKGYAQVHSYGVAISYCPFCGKKFGEEK